MSFCLMEGERYRIRTDEYVRAERQLSTKFICMTARMTSQEYNQYIENLRDEVTDYWFAVPIESGFVSGKSALCEFGFISNIDAMGFKLRWVE